ncbi:MAG: hypothetical protein IJS08_11445 [Victivallales bacterium]|nr:hypothetical protein [Victivallales bacterium]
MFEEFDLDVRRSALTKSYEKLQEKFKALRMQTFIGLMQYSTYFVVDTKNFVYELTKQELERYSKEIGRDDVWYQWYKCQDYVFDYFNNFIHGSYQKLSLDREKLVEPFKDLENYYAQTLTLLSDRNQTLCKEFGQKLISFRADMLRLQTDIAFILRRNMIDEVEEQGKITLDNITSGQNLLNEADDSQTEEMVFESTSSEDETNLAPGEL